MKVLKLKSKNNGNIMLLVFSVLDELEVITVWIAQQQT